MWVVRPARQSDFNALVSLAQTLGSGMTTFPPDRNALAAKLEIAVASFAGKIPIVDAQYLLVLEDQSIQQVIGVSAVYAQIGHPFGFFSYHSDRLVQHSPQIQLDLDCQTLSLSNAYTGITEIGTLAVRPEFRRTGAGRLLARARYLLIACFPDLFATRVIAEMRGWQNAEGQSPFWCAVGQRFFNMPFEEADMISATKGNEWIANLMPKFPIYVDLLPDEARAVIGKAHESSAIAMKMLLNEGFRYDNYVDVFDAGPQVVAITDRIKTIRDSFVRSCAVRSSDGCGSQHLLIANPNLEEFRIIDTIADVNEAAVVLDSSSLEALRCNDGSRVRLVPSDAKNNARTAAFQSRTLKIQENIS
jgi:arginine N-succinyltransferase